MFQVDYGELVINIYDIIVYDNVELLIVITRYMYAGLIYEVHLDLSFDCGFELLIVLFFILRFCFIFQFFLIQAWS
jgi:hypothetical protein